MAIAAAVPLDNSHGLDQGQPGAGQMLDKGQPDVRQMTALERHTRRTRSLLRHTPDSHVLYRHTFHSGDSSVRRKRVVGRDPFRFVCIPPLYLNLLIKFQY